MADNPLNDGIFREVDDDLKREKLEEFWKEYGNTIIACVVILILGTGVNSFISHYKHSQYVAQTDQLIAYMEEAGTMTATERLEKLNAIATEAKGGAGDLLRLQLAAEQYQTGDLDAALVTYAEVEENAVHEIYEELAELQMIRIRMEKGEEPAALIDEVEDLAEEDAPFRFSARELLGLLKKQAGDIDAANRIFQNLSMNGLAPESLRRRAAAYISYDEGDAS